MSKGELTALQQRDLDLFLHGRATLDDYAARVLDRLRSVGIKAHSLQAGTSMHRLQVEDRGEQVVLDLVAESVPVIEQPTQHATGGPRSGSIRPTRSW